MPIISSVTISLTASQNGTRVRIDVPNPFPPVVNVVVGSSSETWPVGTYIEVVRLPSTLASVSLVPAAGVVLNVMSGTSLLSAGEYARVSLNPDGTWDLHIYKIPVAYTPTVGGKPRPLTIRTIAANATSQTVGSALDHSTSWRSLAITSCSIQVKADSFWTGTDEYWMNDFNPTNPGPMPIGGSMIVGKHGTGLVTFVPDAGVTIYCADTLVMDATHGKVTLIKVAVNEWELAGRLVQ